MTNTNIFDDQTEKSMTFQALKMIFQNSMTFQVFHDPYEPCAKCDLLDDFVIFPYAALQETTK